MIRTRAAVLMATATLGTLLMSACSSAGPSGSAGSSAGPATAAAAPSATAQAQSSLEAAADAVRLVASELPDLGTVVTDGGGMTLYRFDRDSAKPSKTNCLSDCAAKFPPVLVSSVDAVQLTGVGKAVVGTVPRPGGSLQLTVGGWPVYRYAKDAEPGDAGGQGIGKAWYAITPLGKKATATAPAPAQGGYGY